MGTEGAMERKRWREVSLVVLGVVLHSLYMLSIFDIYFKSPIVTGMQLEPPNIQAPANRLVLFIGDGMRADKFFEMDRNGVPRAPFLHNIMHKKGRWGVSHARPPTESRPGHVAIIAGFYEDPSAVTKGWLFMFMLTLDIFTYLGLFELILDSGQLPARRSLPGWKANPVEFDSVFNRSRHTVAFGSPDIVPIFCGALPHTYWDAYSTEFEDFATDASFLDQWAFDRLARFLNESKSNATIQKDLEDKGLVIFLHLLGCDTNGHAHRPYSDIYLNNINLVDRGIESTVKLMEEYFPDGRTAYVFTADHGMSNKGSHGDGDPANTETPIVAWGAGVRGPGVASHEDDIDDGDRFVDQHTHHEKTPDSWHLKHVERTDMNQGDIAALMSTLLGLPCPLNSVGTLPTGFLALEKKEQAHAMFANAKQILNQVLCKAQLKQATSLFFKPFVPLTGYKTILAYIDQHISDGEYETAMLSAKELMRLALDGLHYFQTYDWLFLMSTIITGYLGWMIYIFLHILESYTDFPLSLEQKSRRAYSFTSNKNMVRLAGGIFMGIYSLILFLERSPPLYHAYLGLAVFFWTEILSNMTLLRSIASAVQSAKVSQLLEVTFTMVISFLVLEVLVGSFFQREVYTGIFLVAGVVGAVVVFRKTRNLHMIPMFVWGSCWFLSAFTLMPTQILDNTALVVGSGMVVIFVSISAWWLYSMPSSDLARKLKSSGGLCNANYSSLLFFSQVLLVLGASGMVWVTTSYREQKKGLPLLHQVTNWSLAVMAILLPLKSPHEMLARLNSIFLGFAPLFLLLSIGYEALFYTALASVLLSWIVVESVVSHTVLPTLTLLSKKSNSMSMLEPSSMRLPKVALHSVELQHTRVGLSFLVLINVAFFGTGNMASVASFEISSVYRFITIFNPYIMGSLLLCKLFVPFILVTCAFSAVTRLLELPRLGCYFIVLLLSDVMTIHFFFLVKNSGSWMDIGQSISHFGIMSAQVVFVLLLFALSSVFTQGFDLTANQGHSTASLLQPTSNSKIQ